jgi:hypothetical protein
MEVKERQIDEIQIREAFVKDEHCIGQVIINVKQVINQDHYLILILMVKQNHSIIITFKMNVMERSVNKINQNEILRIRNKLFFLFFDKFLFLLKYS